MISIIMGTFAVILGGFGIVHWIEDFSTLLKGILPVSFVCGGILTIIAGITSLKK